MKSQTMYLRKPLFVYQPAVPAWVVQFWIDDDGKVDHQCHPALGIEVAMVREYQRERGSYSFPRTHKAFIEDGWTMEDSSFVHSALFNYSEYSEIMTAAEITDEHESINSIIRTIFANEGDLEAKVAEEQIQAVELLKIKANRIANVTK